MDARPSPPPGLPSAKELIARNELLVIAHRGASARAPENTLPAFAAAVESEADLVELDFAAAADGTLVVFHDETLDRTTDAPQRWHAKQIPLASKSAADLQTLDAGSWFSPAFAGTQIPTLAEALGAIAPQAIALIERKTGSAELCAQLLAHSPWRARTVVQAFDWDFLQSLQRLLPELTLAALGEHALTDWRLEAIAQLGVPVVAWRNEEVTPERIKAAHARGLRIWTWTVDDPGRMRALAAWGIDGIITNRPDLLQTLLA